MRQELGQGWHLAEVWLAADLAEGSVVRLVVLSAAVSAVLSVVPSAVWSAVLLGVWSADLSAALLAVLLGVLLAAQLVRLVRRYAADVPGSVPSLPGWVPMLAKCLVQV